jgi:hypothetical protein
MTIDADGIELGTVIKRGYKRLTVIAFCGDPERVWVAERLEAGLIRGNAYIITLDESDRRESDPVLCECGCGTTVGSHNGVPSRWAPGHHQRRYPH